jgi:hypothetical protein
MSASMVTRECETSRNAASFRAVSMGFSPEIADRPGTAPG